MAVVSVQDAMMHLREDSDDALPDVQLKVDAAQAYVEGFLDCHVYATEPELSQARQVAIERLSLLSPPKVDNSVLFDLQYKLYIQELNGIKRVIQGVVVNPAIHAAILLMIGHLYAERENVEEIPRGVQSLLMPYRRNMGV